MATVSVGTDEHVVSSPPGPRGHWLWGTVREFRRDILCTMQSWVPEYGDAIRFRFFLPYYSNNFRHPEHNKYILKDNNHN